MLIACCLVVFPTLVIKASHSAFSPALAPEPGFESMQLPADCFGEPCDAVARGRRAFFDRRLHGLDGNGRACADCHMATDHFQLSPASVESRFRHLQLRRRGNPNADDPLFRSIDPDDFRINGENASDFSNLRENGLVRIVFTLHHAQIQNLPQQQLLDDLASFQRVLFTNHRVRALSDAITAGDSPLPDPDPSLNELEEQGKVVFVRACAQCHGGPGQSTTQAPVVRFHDIFTQCPRPVDTAVPARFALAACPDRLARNARTYEITVSVPTPCPPPPGRVTPCPLPTAPGMPAPPLPAGAKVRRTSSDPGRALLTGFVGGAPPTDDWNKFDIPALRGISKTAPYFHNNSAGTLEEVVDHYVEFFKRVKVNAAPGVVPPITSTDGVHFDRPPTPEERAALLAYLRKL